ncbi:GLPGLI family protein [Flavobacterium terrae]|uniref:GLPGLI family protein n=1 Tax=Flavobacterium terrae TaxID=415425 RepID=A0A1M6DRZ5_9FLAO|nr:GLPGLI family protein [Flavobacterium terrae]SHI75900.1 GLPGLI family protein [Flavobacterium terrae]
MKNILIILFSIIVNTLFSQKNQGIVYYKINEIGLTEPEKTSNTSGLDLFRKIKQNLASQEFILEFNNEKSHFFLDPKQKITDTQSQEYRIQNIALIYTLTGEIFFNKTENELIIKKNDGTLVKKNSSISEWQITKESKMIDGILCYMATQKINYIARDGKDKTKTITAWFAPSLPYNFGPKEFNNLPGLILEIKDGYTTLTAYKINLNFKKNIEIEIPKGKFVKQEEYEKKLKAQMGM